MSQRRIDKQSLIKRLRRHLPAGAILSEEEDCRPYECDGLSAYRRLPWLVVLPENIEQTQAIVKLCDDHRIDIIARGAGTGLSGGVHCLKYGLTVHNVLEVNSKGAPDIIATANIGCWQHLRGGTDIPVAHWIELLADRMT